MIKNFDFVNQYAGLCAFGHLTMRKGYSESLYRIINYIILTYLSNKQLLDARGNSRNWKTMVIYGIKNKS